VQTRSAKSVLIVVDNPDDAELIRGMFKNQGSYSFSLIYVSSLEGVRTQLASGPCDVILLDLEFAGAHGREAVRQIHTAAPRVAVVLLATLANESIAIESMREGVQDYLIKEQLEPRELMHALRNAIERKVIEEALFQMKERAQVTLDCISDAVICTDLAGNISFLNPAAETMTGWALHEAVGRPLANTLLIMDATTRIRTPNPMAKAVEQDRVGSLPGNCILIRRDLHEYFIEDSVAPIHNRDGMVAGSVLIFRDASVAHALAAQIAHLAEHDSLTGLPNRLLLNDRLGQAIAHAERHKSMVGVMFLDLDGFKHINDSLGHPTGDKLLQSIAKSLQDCIRIPDTVSRQGGDEFLVLLQDLRRSEDAIITAERILATVARAHSMDERDFHVTASIGVSIYPDDGLTPEVLIKNADTAMYQAKEGGRQCFRFFKPQMNVRAVRRQSLEEDLRLALEREEFDLNYQPILDLETGEIKGAEALIRWNHPTRGLIQPAQFIPVAEDSGLILPIGDWVMQKALRQAKAWTDAGLPTSRMAINVSAVQLQNEHFHEDLLALLGETGIEPSRVELELTESVLMKYASLASSLLQELRNRGVRVSIDDFGIGYSSFSYLREFPLSSLKIDRSFVRRIAKSCDDAAIVTAIITMARSLNLHIIAEGIETPAELAFIQSHGCDEGQGYLFSRPVAAKQFANLLEAQCSREHHWQRWNACSVIGS
jgi:diguanylate cyclase (GGDEF)-like protein/PAS domain S-box-containing protein